MSTISPLKPLLPKPPAGCLEWRQLYGSAKSLAIANAAHAFDGVTIIMTPDILTANQLEYELQFFEAPEPILNFPDWETLPYDAFSPHHDIISQRLHILSLLPTLKQGVLIVPIKTLIHRLPPRHYLSGHGLLFKKGQQINPTTFSQELQANGYHNVAQVMEHGEFSIRGSIIDLFPMGCDTPYRIDLFDDEIDSIRLFDTETQRSLEKINEINLLPAYEFPLNDEAITLFREKWRDEFSGNPMDCSLYQDISEGHYSPGIEYYLPLFFQETASLLNYLPPKRLMIRFPELDKKIESFWQEINYRYDQLQHDRTHPILLPKKIFFTAEEIFTTLKPFQTIRLSENSLIEQTGRIDFATTEPPELNIDHKSKQHLHALQQFLSKTEARFLFCAETTGRRESLLNLLKTAKIEPAPIKCWHEFLKTSEQFSITVAPLEQGLLCTDPNITVIAESQLFGQRIIERRRRKKMQTDTDSIVRNLTELHVGDPVVHIDHGIGRFLGLETITIGGQTDEYLTIQYAGKDKLFVPVSSLHLISRYSGGDIDQAPLHKLGTNQWDKIRRKASERVRDVAAELLDIYARRAARKGYAYAKPNEHYYAFAASFPFNETPDQETAIAQTLADMEDPKPMDRLICGDVGFGKTEVAMRAAFIALQDNKQVAILVPTTLLAQQHLESFKNRFAEWPIKVDMLSRFRSQKEQTTIIDELKEGKIDIIIGTHKLIQKNIQFKDLGLLIIDEEHRFGVTQKERLKSLRSEVDILTLTATPIPRTLNMAFANIRDLSIIATPPERRLSIKTFVQKKNNYTVREAILREITRGGQVYYLHNNVSTIERTAHDLQTLVPEARVAFAHGQMHEHDLEHVMSDFYHRRFNVLVCTTIIETGIDSPSTNTIIIERADKFGLAQLHQLRGRVGRSYHQAYAYLLVPSKEAMTKDALKRLDAIESLEDLGAGFMLATHDMEIRGAGELLGDEQSGHMQSVGFNLYMEMLERAVKALKSGKQPELDKPFDGGIEINCHIPALIPEDYLPNVQSRLILYKRIANAKNAEALTELRVEMIDRFGLLPTPTKNLFIITELKLLADSLGVKKIDASEIKAVIEFTENPQVDLNKIIKLVQKDPNHYQFAGSTKLKIVFDKKEFEKRIMAIENLLKQIM